MLINPKYEGYQEPKTKIILRENIADITPYQIILPEPPKIDLMGGFGLNYQQQYFQREVIPEWVCKLTNMWKNKKKRADVWKIVRSNPEYADFIESQWRKRREGVWMLIRGVPTYFPGTYWFHLNYYHMDIGLPDYRRVDLEYYYWWQYAIVENPRVYGGIEISMRRDGKSYRAGSNGLEYITRSKNSNFGIQSKTDLDGKDAFQNKIILPFYELPFYFRPIDDSKLYPSKEINFRVGESEDSDIKGLNSWIEARASVFTAFDGTKLKFYWLDEPGKTTEMPISETWRVHKKCLQVGGKIMGKAILSTTVEETVKGGLIEFVKIWNQSDHAKDKLRGDGQTVSGLVRYFRSCYETMLKDQYGEPIIGDPKPYQREWLKSQGDIDFDKGGIERADMERNASLDPDERVKQKRLLPTTVREALSPSSKDCEFNAYILEKRLEDFRFGNDDMEEGNFEWKDLEQDTEVIWVPLPGGRFRVKKFILPYLLERANKVSIMAGSRVPQNEGMGVCGADPYAYDATSEERKSLGTAHFFMNLDLQIEEDYMEYCQRECIPYKPITNNLIVEYGFRHRNKKLYGEDLIKMCVFLGVKIFPEINVAFLWDYFTDRGYEKFLKYRKIFKKIAGQAKLVESTTPGASTKGGGFKEALFAFTAAFIEESGMECSCHEFLNDCTGITYKDMSPYDYAVSGMYAIYAAKMVNRIKKQDGGKPQSCTAMWQPQVIGRR